VASVIVAAQAARRRPWRLVAAGRQSRRNLFRPEPGGGDHRAIRRQRFFGW
jgi:hypothetical protein